MGYSTGFGCVLWASAPNQLLQHRITHQYFISLPYHLKEAKKFININSTNQGPSTQVLNLWYLLLLVPRCGPSAERVSSSNNTENSNQNLKSAGSEPPTTAVAGLESYQFSTVYWLPGC
jgi:hypothetical protein